MVKGEKPQIAMFWPDDVVETSEPSEDTGPLPYRYEPRRVQRDDGQQQQQSREDETESQTDRLGNTDWCGMCQTMPSVPENVCCHERGQIWQKIEEQTEVQMSCITEHPGFQSTCLDIRSYIFIPTFFLSFVSRKFRYIAYRQLVRWCWGYLGRKVRVALPSCAVNKIRQRFPADFGTSYIGLQPPNLQ
ncbi:uncharacterized protein [Porites lutea]|uniref:uncharacterized protein n=1 Tax=Porites lutea TaxID=51062 RepID=UPI003CC51A16